MKTPNETNTNALPTTEQLERELYRVKFNSRYFQILRSTLYALIITAAVSVLVASLLLPVLQIYGESMRPTLNEGDIVVSIKKKEYQTGEIVGLYYSNRVLVKRVIAGEFDTVEIDEEGSVFVNGNKLDEPYLKEPSFGENNDIEYPYQVPEGTYFVMGDNREVSVDSRSSSVGCISTGDIVGEIVFVVWPLSNFGSTSR